MKPQMFKLQTPLFNSDGDEPKVLITNEDESFFSELDGKLAKTVVKELGLTPVGDKAFIEGIVRDGQFIANSDTFTREDQGW